MNELQQAIDEWKRANYDASFPVFRHYAELGNAEAQFMMGFALSTKVTGLNEDIPAAADWFRKAHNNGHPHAALWLALMLDPTNTLYEGKLRQSAEEAAKLYSAAFNEYARRAAEGSYEFMYALGNCYACGWGTEVDQEEAEKLRIRLSEVGYNPYTNTCERASGQR